MLRRGIRITLLIFAAVAASAGAALAQCPDGTPPPCGRGAAPVRRDPPLDERAWLILPFVNTGGTPEAAMLVQASVSLLYQDLARWQDVRVVPDARGVGQYDVTLSLQDADARSLPVRLLERLGVGRREQGVELAWGAERRGLAWKALLPPTRASKSAAALWQPAREQPWMRERLSAHWSPRRRLRASAGWRRSESSVLARRAP